MLFGLAGVHVLLTEGQFRLERLQTQSDDAQAQYVRLRLEVAQLESPERIVAAAQERLGMVPPTALTYLTPTGPVSAPASSAPVTPPAPRSRPAADPTQGWASAKAALSSRP
jgi:cell division protein FtsL